jgi:adenosylhomocysteine nucleosidase
MARGACSAVWLWPAKIRSSRISAKRSIGCARVSTPTAAGARPTTATSIRHLRGTNQNVSTPHSTAWAVLAPTGDGRGAFRLGRTRHRLSARGSASQWLVVAPVAQRTRFSARVLPQVPRLHRVLPAVGTGSLSATEEVWLSLSDAHAISTRHRRGAGIRSQGADDEQGASRSHHPARERRRLWLSGMGPGCCATNAAQALATQGATALAVFGVAGALDSSLSSGTLICPEYVVDENGARYATDASWRASLQRSLPTTLRASGSLLSVRNPLLTVAEKANAHLRFDALAVDMESAAVAAIAQRHSLPFISLRAIVDEAGDTVPTALNNAVDAWGRPRALGLITALCRHPSVLGDLPRLYSRMQRATHALRAAAQATGPTLGWRP